MIYPEYRMKPTLALLATLLLVPLALNAADSSPAKKPNVLFIAVEPPPSHADR
jgi:hypothetical protein